MSLPPNQFFKTVETYPVLVVDGNIFQIIGDGKIDTTTHQGRLFFFNGSAFELKDLHQSLKEIDREYYEELDLESFVAAELAEKERCLSKEVEERLSALRNQTTLFFIENYVFKHLRGKPEEKFKPQYSSDSLSDKVKAKKIRNSFFVLSNQFSKGTYLFLGKSVMRLEGEEYKHLCRLPGLEKAFEETIHRQIQIEADRRSRQIKDLEKRKENLEKLTQKRYEEGNFGFRKENGDYYIYLKSDPHAFLTDGGYYCFESTEVGIRVPVSGNNIREVSVDKCPPVVFDEKYEHPCLPIPGEKLRTVCYKGQDSIVARKEIEHKLRQREEEATRKNLNILDIKAIKLVYLLAIAGPYVMILGYEEGKMRPYRDITDCKVKPKTESQYLGWVQDKKNQGFGDIHLIRV